MRLRFALSALLLFFSLPSAPSAQPSRTFQYHAPRPNATNVSPRTGIVIRAGGRIDASHLTTGMIAVTGSQSGAHAGKLRSSSDGKTLIFTPGLPFAFGERITVKVAGGLPDEGGQPLAAASFSFSVAEKEIAMPPLASLISEQRSAPKGRSKSQGTASSVEDSILLPAITVMDNDDPAGGRIFLSNFPFDTAIPNTPHLLILENNGTAFFSKQLPALGLDFKLQPDGRLTYYDASVGYFLALDSTYSVVDTFRCGNGYPTDVHELQVLAGNHALLMSYDYQSPDSAQKIQLADAGADTAKPITVINLILQELDNEKNVVFEWRSQDSGNFKITDATTYIDINADTVDYTHGNAIELDTDGNWLVSSRHMDEITKINRTTGEIIWRLGGEHNEFQFINDSLRFSYQHSIRRLPNGNVILFDNGNYRPNGQSSFSRAVEYQLDEINKTATLVWQYRSVPDIYGFAMGSVQRLANGNTVIGWGSTNPSVTEVTASGEKVYEASLPEGIYSYRAFRHEWNSPATLTAAPTSAPAQTFELAQNYPNPFNPSTTIRYQLPASAEVRLKVYDILGREVAALVNAKQAAGNYTAAFNASRLSSGIYFYRLSAASASGTNVATKKMLLVK